jgi:hypothetical protein
MPQIVKYTAKGQLVKLLFSGLDEAASQAAVAMNVIETPATSGKLLVTEYKMPWDGEILGISILSNAARTAGTLGVQGTVNGTVGGPTATLDATNTTHHHATSARGTAPFLAGDRIGAKITTPSGWTPTTADIVVAVWAMQYLDGV